MKTPSIHIILRFFQIAIFLILFITNLSGQAIELGPFSSDSFCVAAPKPLPVDTINWDDERAACIAELRATAIEKATKAWRDSIAIIIAAHIKKQNCFKDSFAESFTVRHVSTEHHYTLYYYDQAGNLVQTISPEGVIPLDTLEFPHGIWSGASPPHDPRFITRYQYNSLGQVVTQFTPDAGRTDFLYDRVQRLRFSQNAEQQPESNFAYTKYDDQGRVVEVGEVTSDPPTEEQIKDQSFPGPSDSRNDTIMTLYDGGDIPPGIPSSNTRGRIAEVHNGFIKSFYDYDAHGNVRELTHIMPQLIDSFITLKYDYDLISGNVNRFRYEPGELDQLTQRYTYDADNRIQSAYSSDDGHVFEEDARYFYYLHGPLARVELGEDKVQGLDYIYTLQGWLKSMNMPGGNPAIDPGNDGYADNNYLDRYFGRDTTSYWLGYNDHDYDPIKTADLLSTPWLYAWSGAEDEILPAGSPKGLFNGNIPLMMTDNGLGLQSMAYQYDALHRIKSSKSIKWDNEWSTVGEYGEPIISYDANGNIDTLSRHDQTNSDILKYHYYTDYPNRLEYVSGTSDLSEITPQSSANYEYDPIGNLILDHSEESEMTWDVYGKLRSAYRPGYGTVEYTYDTQGNRITKNYGFSESSSSIYVRDASGNIIAVYDRNSFHFTSNYLSEFNIYGSNRLGVIHPDRVVDSDNDSEDDLFTLSSRGQKSYELSNHLGNVLNTISDRKLGQDIAINGITDYYIPGILSHADYYPFGLEMPGRTMSSINHRFGFNGKEKDPSISSVTNYDYGFRIYNPAIGRFLSVDPLTRNYPWYTPYQFAGNTPIQAKDLDGLEIFYAFQKAQEYFKPELKNSDDRGFLYGWIRSTTLDGIVDKFISTIKQEIENPSPRPTLKQQLLLMAGGPPLAIGIGIYNQAKSAIEGNSQSLGELSGDIVLLFSSSIATKATSVVEFPVISSLDDAVISAKGTTPRLGGRLGSASTRIQIDNIASSLESRGYTITGGGGRLAEEFLKSLGGGRKGSSFIDITATHPNFPTLRVNTVDVYKNGLPTLREIRNATRIRQQIAPREHLLLIPKT